MILTLGLKERMHQNLKWLEKASYLLWRIVSVLYFHNGSKMHYGKGHFQRMEGSINI